MIPLDERVYGFPVLTSPWDLRVHRTRAETADNRFERWVRVTQHRLPEIVEAVVDVPRVARAIGERALDAHKTVHLQ